MNRDQWQFRATYQGVHLDRRRRRLRHTFIAGRPQHVITTTHPNDSPSVSEMGRRNRAETELENNEPPVVDDHDSFERPQEEPEPDPHESYERYRDDTKLYLLAEKIRHHWSESAFSDILQCARANHGTVPLVSQKDVKDLERRVLRDFDIKNRYFCGSCDCELPNTTTQCSGPSCVGQTGKRSTKGELKVVTTYSVVKPLVRLIKSHFDEILHFHSSLHNLTFSPTDSTSTSQHFTERIETSAMFNSRQLRLQAILNYDGFSFQSQSKATVWPAVFALMDFHASQRYSPLRLVPIGFYRGRRKPSQRNTDAVFQRLRDELQDCFPLQIEHNGKTYSVELVFTYTAFDCEGSVHAFNFEGYAKGRCQFCNARSVYMQHAYRFPTTRGQLRSADWVREHSSSATEGFRGNSIINQIIPMSDSNLDWLHVVSEGVLKCIIRDIQSPSRRPTLRVSGDSIAAADFMADRFRAPTYYDRRLMPISEWKKMCGSAIELSACVTVPLLLLTGAVSDPLTAAYTFLVVSTVRKLLEPDLTPACLTKIALVIESYSRLWLTIFPLCPLKYKDHLFLCHVPYELTVRGNPIDYSTNGCEHNNLFLKSLLSPLNTRSFDTDGMKRLLLWRWIHEEVARRSIDTRLTELKMLSEKITNRRLRCLKNSVKFNEAFRINFKNALPFPEQGHPSLSVFRLAVSQLGGDIEFHSRVAWFDHQISSADFWTKTKKSQTNYVCFRTALGRGYGKVRLIISRKSNSSVHFIVDRVFTESLSLNMLNYLKISSSPHSQIILRSLLSLQSLDYIDKCSKQPPKLMLISQDQLYELAAKMTYKNDEYICALPVKKRWV